MKCLRKKRKAKKQQFNIRYIVVHTTGTKPGVVLNELDKLPYHYLITKGGKLINLNPLQAKDGTIEIALSGGMDKKGNHVDTRTDAQSESLFNTLVMLSEAYPEALLKGADEIYKYAFANPAFNLKEWLNSYVPVFLEAA